MVAVVVDEVAGVGQVVVTAVIVVVVVVVVVVAAIVGSCCFWLCLLTVAVSVACCYLFRCSCLYCPLCYQC